MKRATTKGSRIIRWLSGGSVSDDDSPPSISRFGASPPPLTESSSVTGASTSGPFTPKTTTRHVHLPTKDAALGEKRPAVPIGHAPPPKQPDLRLPPPHETQRSVPGRREPATRLPPSQLAQSFCAKTPRTPPRRNIDLPALTQRQPTLSLPPDAPRPFMSTALVVPPRLSANHLLRYHPLHRVLFYDLVMPPFSISQLPPQSSSTTVALVKPKTTDRTRHKFLPLSPSQLSKPATVPPTRHIRLISERLEIPWPIDIRSRKSKDAIVTVQDFINEFYYFLQIPVTREEWNRPPQDFREEVKRARERRCAAFITHRIKPIDFQKTDHLRRIDFFLDMTIFAGLQRRDEEEVGDRERNDGATTWLMMLEPRP